MVGNAGILNYICKIGIFSCIFIIVYNVVKRNFYKVDEKFYRLVGVLSEKQAKKLAKKKEMEYLRTGKETFRDRLDNIISKSRINSIIPFFDVNFLLFIGILMALILGAGAYFIQHHNIALIAEGIALGMILPTLILEEVSINIFNKADKELDILTIKGLSHAKSKSTLITILIRCEEYVNEPVKSILTKLINDLNRGVTKEVAFNSAIEGTENIRLKQLFTNLLVTSQNEGNYKKVFQDTEERNKDYFELKDMTRDKIREGKSSIAGLVITAIAAFFTLNKNFPNMSYVLNYTMFGQIIIAYFGAVIIFLIYKFFSFSKINY